MAPHAGSLDNRQNSHPQVSVVHLRLSLTAPFSEGFSESNAILPSAYNSVRRCENHSFSRITVASPPPPSELTNKTDKLDARGVPILLCGGTFPVGPR
jgi:hypothetical protein